MQLHKDKCAHNCWAKTLIVLCTPPWTEEHAVAVVQFVQIALTLRSSCHKRNQQTSILIDPTFSWCTKRIITYFDWSHYFMAKEKAVIRGHYRGWCWEQKIIFLNLVYIMLPTIICLCTGLSADSYCESTRYDYWSQFELCVFCSNPMHGSAFPQICHVSDTKSQCDTDTESQNQCWYHVIVMCTRFTLYLVFLHFMEISS